MPEDSPSVKVSAVRDTYGAEVKFCRPTQEAREAMSAEIVAELRAKNGAEKAEEIHPNQDIRVVNGQGSVGLEILGQQPDLDAIVVSIGGGGLISGIATYVKHINKNIKLIGAEPERARSAFMSKQAGKLVKNPPNTVIETIADSVKSSLGPTTYPVVQDLVDAVFTVTEQEIEDATKFTLERAKQVIEPGCGVAVAVATSKQLYERFPDLQKIGVVLCGGNIDLDNLPWSELFKRMEDHVGTKVAVELCEILNEPAMTFLRVNTARISRDKVFTFLSSRSVPVEKTQNSQMGLLLTSKQNLLEVPEYKLGYFEIQDESSQIISAQVDAKPGDMVLDYCAGSGGKALCIAPPMLNRGQVYLHDVRDTKLFESKRRFRKANIQNYTLLPPSHPQLHKLRGKMDWVLVDAPCSQTGALRRNPDMKWTYSDDRLWKWVALQREIFEAALKYVKDKWTAGRLCTPPAACWKRRTGNKSGSSVRSLDFT
ncbi:SRR [Symbiodinium pilosum]|uniref:SRR protein n=1 Tax=Symbiodinium pilosum TaxID=2952 RepID=A0A812WY61_SYMPI|nr:SRR [Symbiodinium pilosum]